MNAPEGFSSYQANLQRGGLLRAQNRYAEAEPYLQRAIGEQPANAEGYYQLAFCYCDWAGHGAKALATIDRAISLDPNRSHFFSLRAWILGNLKRNKEAVRVAEQALELNPHSVLALNAKTRAYSNLQDWKQVESQARRTLAINSRNELAANLLALGLRQQGRLPESEAVSASLLALAPASAMAHSSAGWSALQAGDHQRANRHFLEALRLDPDSDYARRGLLHSFNSRVWIYRVYFQFVAWLGKHRKGMRFFFLALVYIAWQLVIAGLRKEYGSEKSVYWIFVGMALYLIIFGFGRSFGNLFLLLDPFARHALTAKEKRWSIFVGIFYGFILGFEIVGRAWPQTAVLAGVLAFFLWGVLFPRIQAAFSRRSSGDAVTG
jgi:tetratricopeptide (TPR) repeat protein